MEENVCIDISIIRCKLIDLIAAFSSLLLGGTKFPHLIFHFTIVCAFGSIFSASVKKKFAFYIQNKLFGIFCWELNAIQRTKYWANLFIFLQLSETVLMQFQILLSIQIEFGKLLSCGFASLTQDLLFHGYNQLY